MPSILSVVHSLQQDYPDITFAPGETFQWQPAHKTVTYQQSTGTDSSALLLHEVGHALLGHSQYHTDVELLAMERQAWDYAKQQLQHYAQISDDVAEDSLDSYRDWIHARSTCPSCTATGIQKSLKQYRCLACSQRWTVNEARTCALRRRKL